MSKRSFEHRRQWIEDRLHQLARIFSIDLCAYSVMSNHFHVVLRIDTQAAQSWTATEVIERWGQLYGGPPLVQELQSGAALSQAELKAVSEIIEVWRERLTSISWFMRCINEPIARRANIEDQCTGRFWEGRFKSQALLDHHALLQCMAYVDLNPIRAAIARTPEESDHTSIQARIQRRQGALAPFSDTDSSRPEPIPIAQADYLQLVDWTGRVLREDRRGAIAENTPPILERLAISPGAWVRTSKHYGKWTYRIVGTSESLKEAARQFGQRWFKGAKALA